jgi:hypothetical protein
MKFPYQFAGGPMSWKSGPPRQARAPISSLGDPTLYLPAPGAPEPINNSGMGDVEGQYVAVGGLGDCGCGCKGAGTCGKGMGEVTQNAIGSGTTIMRVGSAAAAYLAYKQATKTKKGATKYVLYAVAAAAAYEAVFGNFAA